MKLSEGVDLKVGTFPIVSIISNARIKRTLLCKSMVKALLGSFFFNILKSSLADFLPSCSRNFLLGSTFGKLTVPASADIKTFIHLSRVGRNYFSVEFLG